MEITRIEYIKKNMAHILNPIDSEHIVEIRAITRGRNIKGFFYDNIDDFARDADKFSGGDDGIYYTLNIINPALIKQKRNGKIKRTKNSDIIRRRWILVDIDAIRKTHTSSTDGELEYAIQKAKAIKTWLDGQGWKKTACVIANSGNGGHVLYRTDIDNSEASTAGVKAFLEVLHEKFSDPLAKVDTGVSNLARISKIYGTLAKKGKNTPERPHRTSKILLARTGEPVTLAHLAGIIAQAEPEPKGEKQGNHAQIGQSEKIPYTGKEINLLEYLENFKNKHNIEYTRKITGGTWDVAYRGNCVWNTDHLDSMVFGINKGKLSAMCHHNSCDGKGWKEFREHFEPGCYDKKYENKKSQDRLDILPATPTPEEILPTALTPPEYISTSTDSSLREFFDRVTAGNMDPGVYIVHSPTGTGKSYLTLQTAIELIQQGENVLLLFPTKKELSNCYSGVKQHDFFNGDPDKQEKYISIYTADNKEQNDKQPKKLSLSTYGYLGLKGETPTLFITAKKLIENAGYLFCDECQALYQRCIKNIPLAGRYTERDGNGKDEEPHFTRRRRCSFRVNAGTRIFNLFDKSIWEQYRNLCNSRCVKRYNWRSPKNIYMMGDFAPDIQGREIIEPDIPEELMPFVIEKLDGRQIGEKSTLHAIPLNHEKKMTITGLYKEREEGEEEKPDRKGYLNALMGNLLQACIKFEKPVPIDDKEELSKFPVYPCNIPTLSGIDTTPFLQLIQTGKRIIFMSATVPEDEEQVVKGIAMREGIQFERFINSDIPFTFDVTLMETQQTLRPYTVGKIAGQLKKESPDTKMFIVGGDKKQANEIYDKLRGLSPEHTKYFREGNFFGAMPDTLQAQEEVTSDILITYSRSAMTRGENMPERSVAIIDCSQFIPRSALGGVLKEGVNIDREMARIVEDNIRQIVGRLFRSELERIEGKTINDHTKRIVLLLHGIPENVNIQIEPALLNKQEGSFRRYNEKKFISRIEKNRSKSIVNNLLLVIAGEEPDQEAIDKEELAKKKTSEKSKRQRKMSRRTPEEKQQAQAERRRKKVKMRAMAGESWSVIYKQMNLDRVEESEREALYTLWREEVNPTKCG